MSLSGGFTKTEKEITRAILSRLGPSAYAVYSILKVAEWDAARDGWPTLLQIANDANVSERTTQRAIRELEAHGYIERIGKPSRGHRYEYRIMGAKNSPLSMAPNADNGCQKCTPLTEKGCQNRRERVTETPILHIEDRASERQEERQEQRQRQEEREEPSPARGLAGGVLKFKTDYPYTVNFTDDETLVNVWGRTVKGLPDESARMRELAAWKASPQWDDPNFIPSMESFLTRPKYRQIPQPSVRRSADLPTGGRRGIPPRDPEVTRRMIEAGVLNPDGTEKDLGLMGKAIETQIRMDVMRENEARLAQRFG